MATSRAVTVGKHQHRPGPLPGTLSGWLVTGTNGENVISTIGSTQVEAWRLACEKAVAFGMLRGEP
jgi:hypothetical protein